MLQAPTSSSKLDDDGHLDSVRRYILQRWIETGRGPTLVICQQKVEEYLRQCGLPANITLAHYNNIAGLDDFKEVRLKILIGRTAPGPQAMEALAAALSGSAAARRRWRRAERLRLVSTGSRAASACATGAGSGHRGDQHPDPFVEMIRWQVHEGELMQAFGRGRGGQPDRSNAARHRSAVRHLPADHGRRGGAVAAPPSLLVMTAAEGVMLTAPVDMVRLWPELWPNEKAAYRTIQEGVPALPGFEQVAYQLKGPKMKQRLGHFDRTVIADPQGWLTEPARGAGVF